MESRAGSLRRAAGAIAVAACLLAGSRAGFATPWSVQLDSGADRAVVRALALDPSGNAVAAGSLGLDAWLVGVNASGTFSWQRRYAIGLAGNDEIVDIAAHPDGSFTALAADRWVAAGASRTQPVLLRLDGGGNVAWNVAWDTNSREQPFAIAVAPDGTCFVATSHYPSGSVIVARRDASGAALWTRLLDGLVGKYQSAELQASADGGFAVLFKGRTPAGVEGAWIARGDASGLLLWQGFVFAQSGIATSALAPMPDGGWLALGGTGRRGEEAWLQRLAPDGTPVWQRAFGLAAAPEALDVAADGSSVALATSWNRGAVLLRVDAAGAPTWKRAAGSGSFRDGGVRLSAAGDVVLAGAVGPANRFDGPAVVAALDPAGNAGGCLVPGALLGAATDLPPSFAPTSVNFIDIVANEQGALALTSPVPLPSPACSLSCGPDAQEPDDGCGAAHPVGAGPLAIAGNFCDDPDDWLRVEACAGTALTFETDGLGAATDTVLELLAADCATLIASDDNSGVGLGSLLSYTATRSGPLHLRVRQADGTNGIDRGYRLAIGAIAPPAPTFIRRIGPVAEAPPQSAASRPGGGFLFGAARGSGIWSAATDASAAVAWSGAWTVGMGRDTYFAGVPMSDGGAVLVSSAYGTSLPHAAVLSRVDAAGAPGWQQALDGAPYDHFLAIAGTEMPGGGVLLAGAVVKADGTDGAWALRLDGLGAVLWDRVLDVGAWDFAYGVVALPDGSSYIAGEAANAVGHSQAFVTRLDPAGIVAWSRVLSDPAVQSSGAIVAGHADGGVILAASRHFGGPSGITLAKLDATGTSEWQRFVETGRFTHPAGLAATSDGGLLVAATAAGTGALPRATALVLRLDPSGQLAWAREFSGGGQRGTAGALGVQEIPGGAMAALQLDDDPDPPGMPPATLVRLDATGSLGLPCSSVAATSVIVRAASIPLVSAAPADIGPSGTLSTSPWTAMPISTVVANGCDCACGLQSLPLEVSPPAAMVPLTLDAAGRLDWEPARRSGACWFNVYRGDLSLLRTGDLGRCLAPDLALNVASDPAPPPAGGAWFYLVTGESDSGEGVSGYDSLGAPRPNGTPCP